MGYRYANNFSTELTASLAAGATTMSVADASGIANASVDRPYKLTLSQKTSGVETAWEIVLATGVTGNDITIVRQQEGTTSQAPWAVGTKVSARLTAGHLNELPELIAFGPVDFTNGASSATWQAPPGRKLFVDSVEVVPQASGATPTWGSATALATAANTVTHMSLNNDETWLAVGHWSSPGFAVYEVATGNAVAGTPSTGGSCYGVAFNNAGTLLAVCGSTSPYLFVYNTADWTSVTVPALPAGSFGNCKFTADDAHLIVCHSGVDGVTVFETTGWTAVGSGPTTPSEGLDIALSADGTRMAIVHGQPGYRVFNTSDWSVIHSATLGGSAYTIRYSPDGTQLAVGYDGGDDEVHIIEVGAWTNTALVLPVASLGVFYVDWVDNGANLAVGYDPGINQDQLIIVNADTGAQVDQITTTNYVRSLVKSDDESRIFLAETSTNAVSYSDKSVVADVGLNLGENVGSPSSILAGQNLGTFTNDTRITAAVNHPTSVTELYAEPSTASTGGANAVLVIKGYTIEV